MSVYKIKIIFAFCCIWEVIIGSCVIKWVTETEHTFGTIFVLLFVFFL